MEYSIKEIIDIAVGLEVSGYEFYIKCSEKFKEPELSSLFTILAGEELIHKETFIEMGKTADNSKGIYNEEYFRYLKAIGGGKVFGEKNIKIDDIVDSIHTPADAITKAFHDEKESILFYSEIKVLYNKNPEISELLDNIIEEERTHIIKLSELLESLK